MFFGMPWGPFGDPDRHVKDMTIESTPSGFSCKEKPQAFEGPAALMWARSMGATPTLTR